MKAKVKILVGYHRPAELIKNEVFEPIHLGRSLATAASKDGKITQEDFNWMIENMIGDDTGDNISNENRYFNEMTGIYWAWKNYDKLGNPDYIGFVHYRRLFDFCDISKKLPMNYSIGLPYITSLKNHMPLIDCESVYNAIEKSPYIISEHFNINPVQHYENGVCLRIEDYNLCMDILDKECPKYTKYAQNYNNNNKSFFCNMFVMPKEDFFEYAEFMFTILFEHKKRTDFTNHSIAQARAFASEWLTAIFYNYLSSKHKINEIPMILFKDSELIAPLKPDNKSKNFVFSADNEYTPILSVAIQSIIENVDTQNNYKIYILNENISQSNKQKLLLQQSQNVKIEFINISQYMREYDFTLFYTHAHFSKAAYYKFLIPKVFSNFDKIVHLDCDVAFMEDPANLYEIDLENKMAGVVYDTGIQSSLFQKLDVSYFTETLKLKNPDNYFNSGVMIFDIKKCLENNLTENCFKTLETISQPKFVDQDILNMLLEDNVKFLDSEWNVQNHLFADNGDIKNLLPQALYFKYINAIENPKLLHFTSTNKPWQKPDLYNSHIFWKYARKSPFYEKIIYNEFLKFEKKEVIIPTLKYKNFMQKVFSVKNMMYNEKKIKIITIFGKQIKLKRNNK